MRVKQRILGPRFESFVAELGHGCCVLEQGVDDEHLGKRSERGILHQVRDAFDVRHSFAGGRVGHNKAFKNMRPPIGKPRWVRERQALLRAFGEGAVRLVRDDTVSDVVETVVQRLDEHAFRHDYPKIIQDSAVIIEIFAEGIRFEKIGVEIEIRFICLGGIKKLDRPENDHEEVAQLAVPTEIHGNGMIFVNGVKVMVAHCRPRNRTLSPHGRGPGLGRGRAPSGRRCLGLNRDDACRAGTAQNIYPWTGL
ncbi:hypothetical protein G6F65_019142 [Rhizopus arrhizus]|nr:hypothetical protein G6F65_019142 [Rhizopus arrhizus]